MTDASQGVLPGFFLKDPACRLKECASGLCFHNCQGARHVDYKARSMAGLGAGDGADLPSGEPADFLSQASQQASQRAFANQDPHDGDWDDRQLHLYR